MRPLNAFAFALLCLVGCSSSDSDTSPSEQPADDASAGAAGADPEDASAGEDAAGHSGSGGGSSQGGSSQGGSSQGGSSQGGSSQGGSSQGGSSQGGSSQGGSSGQGGQAGQGTGGAAPFCGDGFVNGYEDCDGFDFAGKSCASVLGVSQAQGSLSCSSSCVISTANCHYCGDGNKNGYEQCDGADLDSKSCATLMTGYTGTLKCSSSCFFDSSGCYPSCTPNCSGKQCGSDGCGSTCGSCSGDATCKSGVCEQCTSSCPTLKTPSLPPSLACTPTASDCSGCGPASCGGPRFAVTCSGAPVGSEYPKPDIPGCQWKYTNNFCCPAGCTRYSSIDATCSSKGLGPMGRACTLGTMGPGCVQLPGYGVGTFVPACCPQ